MTRVIPRLFIWLALGLLLASSAAAANPKYVKPIEVPPYDSEELISVVLDSEIYGETRDGFPDLRVVDTDRAEVAYILRKAKSTETRKGKQTWQAEKLALVPGDDGSLEITFAVDLKKHPLPPQGIRLETRLNNFEHQVRIETSTDKQNWQPLVTDGLIFDYARFMSVRNVAVELPKQPRAESDTERQYYRVTIETATQEQQSQLQQITRHLSDREETSRDERTTVNRQPLRIERIVLWHDEMQKDRVVDRKAEYPLEVARIEQDEENQQTHVYLKSGREPLASLSIVTPERNFHRAARVEVPHTTAAGTDWRSIGSASLMRLDFRTLHEESLSVSFPEHRETEYRLTIDNRDSRPLEITTVTGRGHVYEVVFLAEPEQCFQLAYGSELAEAPRYDTVALRAALSKGFEPLEGKLGPAVESDLPPDVIPWWSRVLNSGPVMTAIIGVLVLVLAIGLYRAARQI